MERDETLEEIKILILGGDFEDLIRVFWSGDQLMKSFNYLLDKKKKQMERD